MWKIERIDIFRDGGSLCVGLFKPKKIRIQLWLQIDSSSDVQCYTGLYLEQAPFQNPPLLEIPLTLDERQHWVAQLQRQKISHLSEDDQWLLKQFFQRIEALEN